MARKSHVVRFTDRWSDKLVPAGERLIGAYIIASLYTPFFWYVFEVVDQRPYGAYWWDPVIGLLLGLLAVSAFIFLTHRR